MTSSERSVEIAVDGIAHGGEGVARLDGKAVFVAGALPGERVKATVVDDRRRWARARLDAVLVASPDRVTPPCPIAGECGGCDLQHVAPEAQRRLKTRIVREQLMRIGGLTAPPVADCRPVGPDVGYRTHAQLHAAPDGRLGFHRAGSHDVVPVDRCLVLTDDAQALRDAVGDATGAAAATVRAHASTSTAAVVLTPGPGALTLPEGDFDIALAQPDGSPVALRGDGTLRETVRGIEYVFDVSTFFQVSPAGADALVDTVLAAAGDVSGALVWDLYAGVGLLSLPLAAAGAEVLAVEGHPRAAELARHNVDAHGAAVEVVTAPVERLLRQVARGERDDDPPDVIVLDPPRRGAGKEVIGRIGALAPGAVVYVACDVAALARDARLLADAGYRLVGAVPLDLFPMTHHVEVVAHFVR